MLAAFLSRVLGTYSEANVFFRELSAHTQQKHGYSTNQKLTCTLFTVTVKDIAIGLTEFQKLVDSQITDQDIRNEIDLLLSRKLKGEELDKESKIQILNDFIEKEIDYFEKKVNEYNATKQPETEKLNILFVFLYFATFDSLQV